MLWLWKTIADFGSEESLVSCGTLYVPLYIYVNSTDFLLLCCGLLGMGEGTRKSLTLGRMVVYFPLLLNYENCHIFQLFLA